MRMGFVLVLALTWFAGRGVAGAAPEVVTIAVDGTTRNILILRPSVPPVAAVVMFPGGDGRIGITASGGITRDGNFLIRTRDAWLARGFLFVAVDAAEAEAGRKGDRVGATMRHAIVAIVQAVRQRGSAPIWLLGTSAGAPAPLAGAAALPAGAIRGVVISSPVSTAGPRDSVFDAPLARIGVPVLIQVHRDDACRLTPPANAATIRAALTAAPAVAIQTFTGGQLPRSAPCEAFAAHGFYGIEDRVVGAAADWIVAH